MAIIDNYDPWRHVAQLEGELKTVQEEREKYRVAATVMCGAHIGVPQSECPVCRCNRYEKELAGNPVLQTQWEKLVAENEELKEMVLERDKELHRLAKYRQ